MHNAGERGVCPLLLKHDAGDIFVGVSGMYDDGHFGFDAGTYVFAKGCLLIIARGIVVEIIQTCLPYSHDFWI